MSCAHVAHVENISVISGQGQADVKGKPKVMQLFDNEHFRETHEQEYGPRIKKGEPEFKPTSGTVWHT